MYPAKETINLIKEVVADHPGAYVVQTKLQWYTRWYHMMLWLKNNGYVGVKLYELYSDRFNENFMDLGKWITNEMKDVRDYRKIEKAQKIKIKF